VNSLILSTAARVLLPVILVLSVFVLLRGHNAPGGGFIGGLLAASAFALVEKAEGLAAARRALRFRPESIAAVGLGCALASGVWGGVAAGAFLKGMWPLVTVDADGNKHGLPLGSIPLFDLGVYLVVLGTVLAILFALEESVAANAGEDEEEEVG
jgi:multicomponent Na+:H+ antiporter subunit B